MPVSSRHVQHLAKRLASREYEAQAAQHEERYQAIAQQFNLARVQYQALYAQCRAVQQEHRWLEHVVVVKQHLIDQLLPYYPHPLTSDMVYAVELY